MTDLDAMTGQCLCGAVKFTATGVDPHYHACHCPMCLRWGGSAFAGVDVKSVTFSGEDNIQRYQSSDWAQRGFCQQCGSNLFYYLIPADSYSLCAGTFNDQSTLKLTTEIFVDYQPDGYRFAGDLPRQTEADVLAAFGVDTND